MKSSGFVLDASILLIISVITRGLPFLLLPLLTVYLSPEDFGYVAYLGSLVALGTIFVGCNSHSFLIVKWSEIDVDQRISFIAITLKIAGFMSFLVFICLVIWFNLFSSLKFHFSIMIFITLMALSRSLFLTLDAVLQSNKMLRPLAAILSLQTFLHYGIALFLLEYTLQNWQGKFFGELLASLTVGFITIAYFKRNRLLSLRSQKYHFREVTKYCSPLVFHLLGLWVMGSIDRIMLVEMKGLEAAGIYTVAYTLGMSLDFIHQALSKVWSPWFYRSILSPDKKIKKSIVRFTYSYIFFAVLMLIVFVLTVPHIFDFFIDKRYSQATPVMAIIALGYTLEVFRKLFIGYLFTLNKTTLIAALTFIAAILNIVLNSWLIPNFGIQGAAWATVLTYAVISFITVVVSTKVHDMPWHQFGISVGAICTPLLDRTDEQRK